MQDSTPTPLSERWVGPPPCQWHLIDQGSHRCYEPQVVDSNVLICKKHMRYIARVAGYVPPHKVEEKVEMLTGTRLSAKDATIRQLRESLQRARQRDAKPKREAPTEGHVYFLLSDNLVKIGWASDLDARMKAYSPGARILAVMPGTRKDENRLHKKFGDLKTNRREWFTYHPRVMEEVERIVREHGDPPRDLNEPMTTKRIIGPRLDRPTQRRARSLK